MQSWTDHRNFNIVSAGDQDERRNAARPR